MSYKVTEEQKKLEQEIRSDVDAEKLWEHVEYLCGIGEKFSGTPESKQAVDYFVKSVKEAGVPIDVYEYDAFLSFPSHDRSKDAMLKVVAPKEMQVTCQSHAMSGSTEGIKAQLVDVGPGDLEDYEGLDVAGKVVLVDFAALWAPERMWIAEQKGALAQITISGDPVIHDMIVTTIWGTPTRESAERIPKIPIVSVTNTDGAKLRELCSEGDVEITLEVDIWKGWKKVHLPVVTIPGAEDPDKYFLIHGHFCSWGDGMTDNVGGNAQFIEMAKIFWKHRHSLKRGVKIAWWPGHSQGRYSGSTWFVDQNWEDLNENCIGHINIDSPGVLGATVWGSYASSNLKDFNEDNMKEFSEEIIGEHIATRSGTWVFRAGDQSFTGIGVPRIGCNTSIPDDSPLKGKTTGGGAGGWWWHTLQDTIDKGDKEMLPKPMEVNVTSVARICNAPLLPYGFEPVADDYITDLLELQDAAKDTFDFTAVLDKAKKLKAESRELTELLEALMESYSTQPDPALYGDTLEALNLDLMNIARILTAAYCVETDRFDQDPATRVPPLPKLQPVKELVKMDQSSSEARFLKTGLTRRRNELADALNRALGAVEVAKCRAVLPS